MTDASVKGGDKSIKEILMISGKRALGSGTAGAIAMVAQVSSLMWMRTGNANVMSAVRGVCVTNSCCAAMNYQYRVRVSQWVSFVCASCCPALTSQSLAEVSVSVQDTTAWCVC